MRKWLKSTDTITFAVRDKTAYITLNRPERRNALTMKMLQELHDALLEADDLTGVHSVVLAGAGPDFCAGWDLAGNDLNPVSAAANGAEASGAETPSYRSASANIRVACTYSSRMSGARSARERNARSQYSG